MFEYNRQQKSIQGIFNWGKTSNPVPNIDGWHLNSESSNTTPYKSAFNKKIDFLAAKMNPFLQIEQEIKQQQNQFIADLDFSAIELKSPTSSESYNSSRNENFFKANPKETAQNLYSMESTLLKTKDSVKEFSSIYRSEIQVQVPTFFIKTPQNFREQAKEERKSLRKKVQEEIKQQLRDIYNGKYKITWEPTIQKYQ